jgi:hypothetical protein
MEGITILPGIDDYPGQDRDHVPERHPADPGLRPGPRPGPAVDLAIQRDNGGCPGTIDSDSCSGIKQPAWTFSHLLERFTR